MSLCSAEDERGGGPTCVCWGMFRKLLSRDPMLTNLLGAVGPGVEYAEERRGREGDRKRGTERTREREDIQTAHTHTRGKKNKHCIHTHTQILPRCQSVIQSAHIFSFNPIENQCSEYAKATVKTYPCVDLLPQATRVGERQNHFLSFKRTQMK